MLICPILKQQQSPLSAAWRGLSGYKHAAQNTLTGTQTLKSVLYEYPRCIPMPPKRGLPCQRGCTISHVGWCAFAKNYGMIIWRNVGWVYTNPSIYIFLDLVANPSIVESSCFKLNLNSTCAVKLLCLLDYAS